MAFDFFIALDGHGLNGFEGWAGVARLRCEPDADRWQPEVRFFPGVAGGHATQLAPGGATGYLGNMSQLLLFYDPRTLEEVARCSTLRFGAPRRFYESQTHVVWLDAGSFVTAIGPDFWRFALDRLDRPERIGPHGVTLPHAVKRSPSGKYLFYGAMDVHGTFANQVGVFDLAAGTARVVALPATAWHLGVHPTRDVFYAPTQRCRPQDGDFTEYVIEDFKNYLFEIDGGAAAVTRHLAIPRDLPGALTSDVVVTEDEVLYNCCASGAIARVDLAELRQVRWIDEQPGPLGQLMGLRVGLANVVEAAARANLLGEPHLLIKAVRAARGSLLDGSYGLGLSPCRRFLLSAHRGRNQVIVYRYPELVVHRRIDFPPMRRFARHLGRLSDPRLGFHHATIASN